MLNALADPDYQRRVWVERQYPRPGYYDDLDANISFLYDDSDIAEDPQRNIGYALRNEGEARAIENLHKVLSPLYDALPPGIDDAEVIALPEWQAVVAAARQAVRAFAEAG
ncbi:MAG TPA: hypothetical protein VFU43_11935 [Streptosporangiaceae bacterium]|nr:hypothetical protein [Streptosporangiaceae bacterium]